MSKRVSLVDLAHQSVAQVLSAGDIAIDATSGNGHDTVFLAAQVGKQGRVYACDIQASAIQNTQARLEQEQVANQVTLFQTGHEKLLKQLPPEVIGNIKVCMFNLGYLPGANKNITTQTNNTLTALADCLGALAKGGRMTVIAYTGHPGGRAETEAIKRWLGELASSAVKINIICPVPTSIHCPELLVIDKL